MDPSEQQEAEYDPQSAAISSAYVSAFNDYVRKDLGFGKTGTDLQDPRSTSASLWTTQTISLRAARTPFRAC